MKLRAPVGFPGSVAPGRSLTLMTLSYSIQEPFTEIVWDFYSQPNQKFSFPSVSLFKTNPIAPDFQAYFASVTPLLWHYLSNSFYIETYPQLCQARHLQAQKTSCHMMLEELNPRSCTNFIKSHNGLGWKSPWRLSHFNPLPWTGKAPWIYQFISSIYGDSEQIMNTCKPQRTNIRWIFSFISTESQLVF